MSQERFDSLERMLEQLIHMVGHNNAVTEELCQRMDRLETKVDNLEAKVDRLEAKVSILETKVDSLDARVGTLETEVSSLKIRLDSLECKVDRGFAGLTGMVQLLGEKTDAIPRIEAKIDILNNRLLAQEAEISLLKRAR
ncbi:hypothetical protein [Sporomusa aerivorans]|uniref:hypothetical protein n=1 Tax=Sporomusa aerivorans TaxID=204936 RepID=UPI00352A1E43